jgi:hypothetical protein
MDIHVMTTMPKRASVASFQPATKTRINDLEQLLRKLAWYLLFHYFLELLNLH